MRLRPARALDRGKCRTRVQDLRVRDASVDIQAVTNGYAVSGTRRAFSVVLRAVAQARDVSSSR